MYFKISWSQDFSDLMHHLWGKYGREIFTENGIGDQLDLNKFSQKFFNNKSTTADISIDANANVGGKSVIDYAFEFPKPLQKYNSHFLLWKSLRSSYGLVVANEIIEKQISGEIYINDFSDIGKSYCFNFSTYDVALEGLTMAPNLKISAPKSLESFLRQMEQFVVYAANSTLGATGLADVLIVASHYVDKIIETGYDGNILVTSNPDTVYRIQTFVSERIRSFIYTLNWSFRGNQCVTEDTDVLTPTGWKTLDTLEEGKEIYTWKNGDMNINTVDSVNIYDYDGEMHRYEGRDVIQEVSPNHRVVYKTGSNNWMVKESKDIIDLKSQVDFPISALNTSPDFDISWDKLRFITFILTDGNIDTQSGKATRIKWCKSKNRWGIKAFENLCFKLDYKFNKRTQKSGFGDVEVYTFPNKEVKEILDLMGDTKATLPSFFTKLSMGQSEMVLNLWSKLDGYDKRRRLQCDNINISDGIQHLAFRAGVGSRQYSRLIGDNKTETLYVTLYKRPSKTATNKTKFHYKGRIWCPTTKDGVVIFRKNGKVFVSGNSPFTNLSVYDDSFLTDLVKDYTFPDYGSPKIETVKAVQKIYIEAMNDELKRSHLTFPVTTAAFYVKDGEIQDKKFLQYIAEQNLEFGFINLYYGDTSTLSSCCRLRSSTDNEYFNSFGAGSTKIGSLGVVTSNLPRLAYLAVKTDDPDVDFIEKVKKSVEVVGRINNAKRNIIKKRIELNAMPLYTLGHMDLSKQYSTYGLTGLNEALEVLGYDITSEEGEEFVLELLDIINEGNDKMAKRFHAPHNCEQVPAESSAVKLAKRDYSLGYNRSTLVGMGEDFETTSQTVQWKKLYSNQFIPLTTTADMLDRLRLQGKFDEHFSGGAICHINIGEQIKDVSTLIDLMTYAAKCGVVYWAVNYALKRCEDGHIFVDGETCPKCGKSIDTVVTRTVGFFTNVANWNEVRREEDFPNRQFYKGV